MLYVLETDEGSEISVKIAAPRQISILVRNPAALRLNSRSSPMAKPQPTASSIGIKSPCQSIALPFYECLIDFHSEMAAALLDISEHLVAGLEQGNRNGFAFEINKANRFGVLHNQ